MLRAGCAEVDITPPIGYPMGTFPDGKNRTVRKSKGVHDPLKTKCLFVTDYKQTVVICSCDIPMIHSIDINRIKKFVADGLPVLAEANYIIAATHTHSSAETTYLFGNTPDNPWILEMDSRIASCIMSAYKCQEDVEMTVSMKEIGLNFNRRGINSDGKSILLQENITGDASGPTDSELITLNFYKKNAEFLCVVANYTAHALTVGPGNYLFTADYPGLACRTAEQILGSPMVMFLNGAAGNIHPERGMRKDFSALNFIGTEMGRKIVETVSSATPVNDPHINVVSKYIRFDNRLNKSLSVDVNLMCVHLGTVLIGCIPGELFVEFQIDFKSRFRDRGYFPIIVGYANGWCGYIPTKMAFDEGGYGVDIYDSDPPEFGRTVLPFGAGESIMKELESMASIMIQKETYEE
jgi:neutral ceramidase